MRVGSLSEALLCDDSDQSGDARGGARAPGFYCAAQQARHRARRGLACADGLSCLDACWGGRPSPGRAGRCGTPPCRPVSRRGPATDRDRPREHPRRHAVSGQPGASPLGARRVLCPTGGSSGPHRVTPRAWSSAATSHTSGREARPSQGACAPWATSPARTSATKSARTSAGALSGGHASRDRRRLDGLARTSRQHPRRSLSSRARSASPPIPVAGWPADRLGRCTHRTSATAPRGPLGCLEAAHHSAPAIIRSLGPSARAGP